MSGEDGGWLFAKGSLVGVFVFRHIRSDCCMRCSMRAPLWSVLCACQRGACAFMSAVMIVFSSPSMCWSALVMSVSSVA